MPYGHPYDLPESPKVTIREILVWIARQGEITLSDVARRFRITANDASVRLLKLHRWGYLRRWKAPEGPRGYRYAPSHFGRSTAKRWAKKAR